MDALYAPWRHSYIPRDGAKKKECPFCAARETHNDEESFVLQRTEHSIIMLNKYPYNGGHILIVPHQHVAALDLLSPEVRSDLMEQVSRAACIVTEVLHCNGINIGINIGDACGGSIPEHIHIHVLPRWKGDTGFLPTLAHTKTISTNLREEYELLLPHFSA